MSGVNPAGQGGNQALAALWDLSRRAREASSQSELGFLLVNESHALLPYRQAALWFEDEGVTTLSGVVQPEANAPYALWLNQVCRHLSSQGGETRSLSAQDLPPELATQWADWWPAHALWLPLPAKPGRQEQGGVVFVRDTAWPPAALPWMQEWCAAWWLACHALPTNRRKGVRSLWSRLRQHLAPVPGKAWWQQARVRWLGAIVLVLVLPVRLTVLAPGELVPANPLVVRAPLDGVIDVFHVQPNQAVQKDQPLFGFDEALIKSRLDVAQQNLATAETEYRQTTQQALIDPKFRNQLALLTGKIDERRAEVEYLQEQFKRSRVLAAGDGIALFDSPSEWIGRPVTVGERIMRIARPDDNEVEVWLPLADGVEFKPGTAVTLYLNASPLSPVEARLRYMAHEAVQRPDGQYAFRIRATLAEESPHRVGMKGTAKLHGGWVPLAYWVLRRPWAGLRTTLGI